MTEDALPIAIEARELGRSAHKRLDGINGQVGKANDKLDILDGKVNSILITLATADGGIQAKRGLIDNGKFVLSLIVLLLTSSVVSLLITVALRSK